MTGNPVTLVLAALLLLLLALLAWLVVAGPGLLSLDQLIARRAVSGAPRAVSHSSSSANANAERSAGHGARA